ncbi:uncharacterized protein C7orf50 homolog isoform X2 [Venturia canescens]|uniref:uncharacterized protein C7orf50 homolog isoform X2 n=1 Tax=Venturia canescens TaxID=32260 RepID=UPI001C9C02DB|nr:uncharacterized protein C7orf50 homolog isoform X2 [Venturia canescens]
MGSETETRDLEVKKAHTRNRSKQKQDKEDGSKILQNNSELPTKAIGMEKTKKTRRGKRTANKRGFVEDAISKDRPKRMKKDSNNLEENNDEDKDDDPKKPEEPSKRQIKKEKAEQRECLKREASRLKSTEKALNYVSKWKHARSEWKFEKVQQIWLIDNLLDGEAIPDAIFPTVLEYFEGCKGMAREQLLKKGMDVIRKQEESEDGETEEAEKSIEYKRARELLQALPTET